MNLKFLKDQRYIWMLLGLGAIILKIILNFFPEFTERYYSRGLFLGWRWAADNSITNFPIALVNFMILGIIGVIVWKIIARIRRGKPTTPITWKTRLGNIAKTTGAIVGGFIFLFMLLWGYNYSRVPLEEQLALPVVDSLSLEDIKKETLWATQQAVAARNEIPNTDTFALADVLLPEKLEEHMREHLEAVLKELGYPTTGKVRVRSVRPKGVLLRFGTSGIYWPFVLEGHMDKGLHAMQKPFTMAHEMAHGYGIANEGSCNFLAYLTCLRSNNLYVRYVGKLAYWRYIASEYKFYAEEEYAEFRAANLSRGMANDLEAIYTNGDKYPDFFPQFREASYDAFLKAQGLEDGIDSYSRIVYLLRAWRELNGGLFQIEQEKFQ